MKHFDYFAPEGWKITYDPKPIGTRAFDFSYLHDNYDGENNLCGSADSYLSCLEEIWERTNESDIADQIAGGPAPDLYKIKMTVTGNGQLLIDDTCYSGNIYDKSSPRIIIGLKNGRIDKIASGSYFSIAAINQKTGTDSHLNSQSNGKNPVPEFDVTATGWCTAQSKEKCIEYLKSAIREALNASLERTQNRIAALDSEPVSEHYFSRNDESGLSL